MLLDSLYHVEDGGGNADYSLEYNVEVIQSTNCLNIKR
jgi:hypothetical protein